jgi:myo-inositol-1(or 4)-monophosphatase
MQDWIDFSQELAGESGKLIREYFGSQLQVNRKPDHSPVTIADQEGEALMRRMIEARFPEHQVVGEEGGTSGRKDAEFQWLLDPIDGTNSFIHGVPLFGTLIALLERGRPILGVIHLPVAGDLLIGARDRATTLNGRAVRVSDTRELSEATLTFTCPVDLDERGYGAGFQRLQGKVRLVRSWGDCYGHFMVATGRADIMIDPILDPWDIAALTPCIEGAGGRLTDRAGVARELGDNAVSTNGHLHDAVIGILNE